MIYSIRKLMACLMALLLMSSVLTPSAVLAEDNTSTTTTSIGNVSLNATFVSGATSKGNDLYVWNATSSASGHSFMFNVNMDVNYITGHNSGTIPTGAIKVSVPLHILKNKNGEYADTIELPFDEIKDKNGDGKITADEIPDDLIETAQKSSDELTYFAYYVNEKTNEAIVMNIVDLEHSINDVFDVKYDTTEKTFNYYDYDHDGSVSDAFYAGLTIDGSLVDKTQLSDQSTYKEAGETKFDAKTKSFKVAMDTSAKITNVNKGNPTLYRSWNSSWGDEPETNGLSYYYLIWEIRTRINDPTQSYHFSLTDTLTNENNASIVGFRLAGNAKYKMLTELSSTASVIDEDSSGNAKELNGTGYRYDYVLTRHLASSFTTGYKIKNKITATIDPVDGIDADTSADSTREYSYEAPTYSGETGSAYVEKYGGEHGSSRGGIRKDFYNLADLQAGTSTDHIDGLTYNIHANALPYQWTIKDGGSATNHEDYAQKNVTYEIIDDTLWLYRQSDEKFTSQAYSDSAAKSLESYKLNSEDYDFASLTYKLDTSTASWNEDEQKFDKVKRSLDETDAITWYVKVNGQWLKAVTYNFKNGEVEGDNPGRKYIQSINSSSITFEAGVDGIKAEVTNKLYNSTIDINPSMRLYDTDRVKAVANSLGESDAYIILKNKTTFNLHDEDNQTQYFTQSRVDGNRIRDAQRSSDIQKRIQSQSNDVRNKTFTLSWKVTQDEIMNTDSGTEYITQNGGTFYDLLPEGATLKKDSIVVQSKADPTNNSEPYTIDESMYSVETTLNYKGSGRTLVTIHIDGSYPCFIVNYSTLHSWEDIRLYGTSIRNPIAYETGNDDIAGGFSDDGGKLSSTNKTYFTDLDSTTDAKRFIYDEESTSMSVVTAALAGLDKKVMSSDDEHWMRNTIVSPSSDYAYRLRYSNVKEEGMRHIVLYDRLEQYDKSSIEKSSWRGILTQVDVSQITNTYPNAHPVVYVSLKQDLDLGQNESSLEPRSSDAKAIDDSSSDVWMTLTDYESKYGKLGANTDAIPTGVAIKFADDFSLATNQVVSATLYMKSPKNVADAAQDTYPETYNDAYIYGIRGEGESQEASYLNQGYTSVKYHVTSKISIHKVSSEDENTVIPGISFRVNGTSDYGTEVNETKQTNAQGNVTFKDLEKGSYTLQETEGSDDYLEDHTEYNVKIDEDGNAKIWKNGESEPSEFLNGSFTIENTLRIHTDITFEKRSLEDDALINGAYFKLSGTSSYKNDISMTSVSAGGRVTFSNVERGTYKLEEYKTPDDFIKPDGSWTLTVDQNGVVSISGNDVKEENGAYTIYNEAYHTLKLWKQDASNQSSLANATFSLQGTSLSGKSVNKTETSSNSGFLNFEGLEAGTYVLQETKAPDGYRLDSKSRNVTITRKGKITVDGLDQDTDSQAFVITNTQIPAGTVVVTKKWVDDENTTSHPIPKIHLTQLKDDTTTSTSLASTTTSSAKASVRNTSKTTVKASINNFATHRLLANALSTESVEKGPFTPSNNKSGTVEWVVYKSGSDYILEFRPTSGDSGSFANSNNAVEAWKNSSYNGTILSNLITKVRFKGSISAYDCKNFFRNCTKITRIDFTGFDASNTKSFWNMFNNTGLTSVDVSNWNMSSNTDFAEIFRGAKALREITGLNTWDVSKGTTFARMFDSCTLDEVDLTGWDFSNAKDLSTLFTNHQGSNPKIKKLMMKNCKLTQVTNLSSLFSWLKGTLEEIDLSGSDASNLTTMNQLFMGYSKLKKANLNSMKTPKLTDMYRMFRECTNLQEVNLNGMDTSNVTTMKDLLNRCPALTTANLNQLDVSQVTDFYAAFYGCTSLTELNLSNWDTSAGTNFQEMFSTCSNLEILQIPKLNTTNSGANIQWIFRQDPKLRAVQLGKNFKFKSNQNDNGNSNWLPNAGNGNTPKYSGKWSYGSERQKVGYTVAEVKDIFNNSNNANYNSRAGWWYWQLSAEELNKPEEYDSIDTNWLEDDPDKDYSVANSDGNAGYWQKIDDETWTYTFYVYDANSKWQVSEEGTDLISYDKSSKAATYIADANNKSITLENNNESAVLTNTSKAIATRTYGALSLTKNVVKVDPNVADPTGDSFKFNVTLANEDHPSLLKGIHALNATFTKDGTSETRSVLFNDGQAIIELTKDQTLTIDQLVSGTTYRIVEENQDNYALSSIINENREQTGGAAGKISEATSAITFTNNYLKEAPKTVNLTLTKKITGDETQLLTSGYPFEILLSGLTPDETYTFGDTLNVTADAIGEATISDLTLGKDGSLTLSNVPVGTKYQVKELKGKTYTASYEVTNSTSDGTIASTHGENTEANKDLSTAVETADEGENITVTFTNNLEAELKTRKLKLVKLVSGADNDTNAYEFTVAFNNLKAGTVIHSTRSDLTANANGEANVSYYLKKDESVTFEDIPEGAKYNITEAANIMTPSYVITNLDEERVDVKDTDDIVASETGKESTALSIGKTMPSTNVNVTFTNTAPKTGGLALKKLVTGNMGNQSKLFRFKIALTQTVDDKSKEVNGTFPAVLMSGSTKVGDTKVQFLNGEAEVYLSHNQTLTLSNIPSHAQYSVKEVDYEDAGYHLVKIDQAKVSAQDQMTRTTLGENEVTLSESEAEKTGTIPEDDSILYTYTNDREVAIPTRARTGLSVILLTIVSALAILFMHYKRKKHV